MGTWPMRQLYPITPRSASRIPGDLPADARDHGGRHVLVTSASGVNGVAYGAILDFGPSRR